MKPVWTALAAAIILAGCGGSGGGGDTPAAPDGTVTGEANLSLSFDGVNQILTYALVVEEASRYSFRPTGNTNVSYEILDTSGNNVGSPLYTMKSGYSERILYARLEPGTYTLRISPNDDASKKHIFRIEKDRESYAYLEWLRGRAGLNGLTVNDRVELAARDHADYLALNGVSSHFQTEGNPGFTGESPGDRTAYRNFESTTISEVLTSTTQQGWTNVSRLDGLMSAIYHRLGILSYAVDLAGTGRSDTSLVVDFANSNLQSLCLDPVFSQPGETFVTGVCNPEVAQLSYAAFLEAGEQLAGENPDFVVWPPADSAFFFPIFWDDEVPDPTPDYGVSGNPVSFQLNPLLAKSSSLTSFTLSASGVPLTDVLVLTPDNDPNGELEAGQFVLFPLEPLEYGTEYTASVAYMADGKAKNYSWSFSTLE